MKCAAVLKSTTFHQATRGQLPLNRFLLAITLYTCPGRNNRNYYFPICIAGKAKLADTAFNIIQYNTINSRYHMYLHFGPPTCCTCSIKYLSQPEVNIIFHEWQYRSWSIGRSSNADATVCVRVACQRNLLILLKKKQTAVTS